MSGELDAFRNYVAVNPARWAEDRQNPICRARR
jgi:hypothetical protein